MTTLNSRLTWRKIAVLALLASGLLVTVAPAQDRVYLKQGSPVLGEIKALDANEVRILVRNKDEQQYPIADLLKITFDGEPRELERARELMLQEQFEQALEEINKIAASSVSNPVVRQEIAFTKSYCEGRIALAGTGDKKQASSGLLAVISANRNTHHLYPIAELLGELAFSSGENARPFFDKLATAPDPVMAARGKYHLAEVELSEQKPAEAKVHFQELVTAQSSTPEMTELKNLAEVGLATCDLAAGDAPSALRKLEAMIQKYDSTNLTLFAKIFNSQGACFQALNQPEQALLSYLHTDLLFFAEPELHAEALYQLSKLWPEVGQAARAADSRSRLVKQYASSKWANMN